MAFRAQLNSCIWGISHPHDTVTTRLPVLRVGPEQAHSEQAAAREVLTRCLHPPNLRPGLQGEPQGSLGPGEPGCRTVTTTEAAGA